MHGKEFAMDLLKTYFTVVTMITAAMFVLGMRFLPDMQFGYEAFAVPLIYGAIGTIPNLVMYSRKELTPKKILIRKVIQLILIEILVLFAVFYRTEFWKRTDMVIGVGGSIFVIYVASSLIDWLQNCISAKRMTEELMQFQRNAQKDM